MLLKRVLPKTVATSTKAPQPRAAALADLMLDPKGLPVPHMKAPSRDGKWADTKGKVKTRKPKGVRWRILVPNAHPNHSPKAERHWIAKAATFSPQPNILRTLTDAEEQLEEWGRGHVKMDLPWLVRKGYIELVTGED